MFKEEQARLCHVGGELYCTFPERALRIRFWRKILNFYISILRQGGRPERRSLRELRFVLSPNPPDQGINGPPQKIADIACLGAVLFEEVVEQYDVGGQMPNLGALGII